MKAARARRCFVCGKLCKRPRLAMLDSGQAVFVGSHCCQQLKYGEYYLEDGRVLTVLPPGLSRQEIMELWAQAREAGDEPEYD